MINSSGPNRPHYSGSIQPLRSFNGQISGTLTIAPNRGKFHMHGIGTICTSLRDMCRI